LFKAQSGGRNSINIKQSTWTITTVISGNYNSGNNRTMFEWLMMVNESIGVHVRDPRFHPTHPAKDFQIS